MFDCLREARARKRLAESLVAGPDARLTIIKAVLRNIATRRYREETKIAI